MTAPNPKPKIEVTAPRANAQGYVDTPAKKAVRELQRDWAPLWGGMQEVPPFKQMHHAAHTYDNTSFSDTRRYYALPEVAPTGHGLHHPREDRDTSHFVGKMLNRINPRLADLYMGGAANEHQTRVATNLYTGCHVRAGPLGGLRAYDHKLTGRLRYTTPAPHREANHYRATEIFTH
jgi:hypothetical protein